jgi:NAD(P)-dependent dehydrogenase (short-subunit alcohol dehydrogenase family)
MSFAASTCSSGTRSSPTRVRRPAKATRPSNGCLDEMQALWDTNVFGVLSVYQAVLPLLRATSGARIVNVSSDVGPLATNLEAAYAHRRIFGSVYPVSKTTLNALTVAMALELESEGIKVNAVSRGFTQDQSQRIFGRRRPDQDVHPLGG